MIRGGRPLPSPSGGGSLESPRMRGRRRCRPATTWRPERSRPRAAHGEAALPAAKESEASPDAARRVRWRTRRIERHLGVAPPTFVRIAAFFHPPAIIPRRGGHDEARWGGGWRGAAAFPTSPHAKTSPSSVAIKPRLALAIPCLACLPSPPPFQTLLLSRRYVARRRCLPGAG